MSEHGTGIEWTHVPGYKGETWNPVTGCDRVSPGCAHCYALELAERLKGMGQKRYQRDGDPRTSGPGFAVTLHQDKLEEPLRWSKPRAVFVNSMSDVFHEAIPDEFIGRMFAVMAAAPQHIFMVLTKRPERTRDVIRESSWEWSKDFAHGWDFGAGGMAVRAPAWPLRNVWLGVSIENRRFVHRADLLRQTPAAVRFISAEPLLGPLFYDDDTDGDGHPATMGPCWWDGADLPELDLKAIDWLIVGGESGPSHRPIAPEWVRELRERAVYSNELCVGCAGGGRAMRNGMWSDDPCPTCDARGHLGGGAAFFFKQWGGPRPTSGGRELDGRTWDEFPTQPKEIERA